MEIAMARPLDTSIDRTLPFSSDVALRRRFQVTDGEVRGNLRWGLLLEVLDTLAEDVALAYARCTDPQARVVTAAIDDILLRTPADLHRDLHLRARINYVGRTSMEVGIRVDQPGSGPGPLASCYFTMVARTGPGTDAQNLPLKPLTYVDDLERLRHDLAVQRRQAYKQEQAASGESPSPEEYLLLAELHRAQDAPGFDGLLAGDLVRSSWERMYPEQENVPKKIFGGYLIRRALELALIHVEEVAPLRPVLVRVNRINFLQPVRIGDKLHFTSRVVYTGRSSICAEVGIERTNLDNVTKALSNTCTFTFVNVDEAMRPQPVPRVYPTTYAEDARYLGAHRRHALYENNGTVDQLAQLA
jgi:acyl-CoA hydrolase